MCLKLKFDTAIFLLDTVLINRGSGVQDLNFQ